MAAISQNQYDYLNNLAKAGGGNGEWAKSQLNGATITQPQALTVAPTPTQIQNPVANNTGIPKATTSNNSPAFIPTAYSQGNNFGTSYTTPAQNYTTPSTPSYAMPTAYTGASNVVGNTSAYDNSGTAYSNIGQGYLATHPDKTQFNGWTDSKTGNVYDTTDMTPQQTYALMLSKNGNQNASAILQGMGLDMNGNPTMPKPVSQFSAPPTSNPSVSTVTPQNGQVGQGGMPSTFNPYGLSQGQLSSITSGADAQTAADIAAQTTISNQLKTAYQQNFDRQNQQTADTRNLENFKNSQLLNPFNGFSDYTQGQIARERATTDRQNGQDLQTKLGNVDAQLADYSKSSQAKKQQIISDMESKVADYQLKKDDFNLRAQDQQSRNDIAKSGVTGYYQDSQQVAAVQKQMAANSAAYASATPAEQQRLHEENVELAQSIGGMDTTGNGDYSFGQGQRTMAGQTLDMNNAKDMATLTGYMSDGKGGLIPTNAKQQQDLTNAWKEAETMGYVTPNLSALTGIKVGTQTQTAKNQTMQNAISKQNADNNTTKTNWDMDKNNPDNQYKLQEVEKVKADLAQIGKTKPITTQDAIDVLNKSKFVTEEGTTDYNGVFHKFGKTSVDKPGMVQAIAGLGVPDNQMDSLFNYYGISQKEVQDIEQQLRGNR